MKSKVKERNEKVKLVTRKPFVVIVNETRSRVMTHRGGASVATSVHIASKNFV